MAKNLIGFALEGRRTRSKKWAAAVDDARTKFQIGSNHRSTERHEIWKRSEAQYKGEHWRTPHDDPMSDFVVVNMSFSTVNTIVPYVTGNSPNFLVSPFSRDATARNARTLQALLNAIWRQDSFAAQEAAETATFNALQYGDGYLQVGYDLEEIRTDLGFDTVAKLWIDSVSPWDVWIDPSADGFHNARWIAKRLLMTRKQLEDDARYTNITEGNVSFGAQMDINDERQDLRLLETTMDGSEYAELVEFWDLVNGHTITFSDGEFPLRVLEDIGGIPLVQMGNYPLPKTPYHMGELEQLWGLQKELNKTRSQMMTHRNRQVQKYVSRRGALDTAAKNALQSSVVNDVVTVDGDMPLDQIIHPLQVANLTADVYAMSDIILRDIYEISGVNEYLRGATPAIRRTATEATIIEGASNVKSQHKLRMVEKALRKVGRIMLQTAGDVFPSTDFSEVDFYISGREAEALNRAEAAEAVTALGAIGAPPEEMSPFLSPSFTQSDVLLTPTPETFEGEYEVDVEQSSTELRNPVLREQKFREMVVTVASMYELLQLAGVPINLKRLLELWFEAAGVDDVESLFQADGGGQNQLDAMLGQLLASEQGQGGEPVGGFGGGIPPGSPNLDAAQAPTDLLTSENTGALGE